MSETFASCMFGSQRFLKTQVQKSTLVVTFAAHGQNACFI
jgi:hypothetical protein